MAQQSQLMEPERVVLHDGAVVEIRALAPEDRAALAAAIMRLSERSRYLRFAQPLPVLRPAQLDRLLDLDHLHREALVASDPATGDGVAVARYAEMPDDPAVVDVAVTVADAWQRRGLGSLVLARVLARARERLSGGARQRVGREPPLAGAAARSRLSRARARGPAHRVRARARRRGWLSLPAAS